MTFSVFHLPVTYYHKGVCCFSKWHPCSKDVHICLLILVTFFVDYQPAGTRRAGYCTSKVLCSATLLSAEARPGFVYFRNGSYWLFQGEKNCLHILLFWRLGSTWERHHYWVISVWSQVWDLLRPIAGKHLALPAAEMDIQKVEG